MDFIALRRDERQQPPAADQWSEGVDARRAIPRCARDVGNANTETLRSALGERRGGSGEFSPRHSSMRITPAETSSAWRCCRIGRRAR